MGWVGGVGLAWAGLRSCMAPLLHACCTPAERPLMRNCTRTTACGTLIYTTNTWTEAPLHRCVTGACSTLFSCTAANSMHMP